MKKFFAKIQEFETAFDVMVQVCVYSDESGGVCWPEYLGGGEIAHFSNIKEFLALNVKMLEESNPVPSMKKVTA